MGSAAALTAVLLTNRNPYAQSVWWRLSASMGATSNSEAGPPSAPSKRAQLSRWAPVLGMPLLFSGEASSGDPARSNAPPSSSRTIRKFHLACNLLWPGARAAGRRRRAARRLHQVVQDQADFRPGFETLAYVTGQALAGRTRRGAPILRRTSRRLDHLARRRDWAPLLSPQTTVWAIEIARHPA